MKIKDNNYANGGIIKIQDINNSGKIIYRKWNEEWLRNILRDLVKEQVHVFDKEKVKDYLKGYFVDIII